MPLEESGNSKDVPPLSCWGKSGLSTFVENRVVSAFGFGLILCIKPCSHLPRPFGVNASQEVLD